MACLDVIPVPIAILFLSLNRLFSRLPVQLMKEYVFRQRIISAIRKTLEKGLALHVYDEGDHTLLQPDDPKSKGKFKTFTLRFTPAPKRFG
jgi:hypothetical protein